MDLDTAKVEYDELTKLSLDYLFILKEYLFLIAYEGKTKHAEISRVTQALKTGNFSFN